MTFMKLMRRPSAFLPVGMSLAALGSALQVLALQVEAVVCAFAPIFLLGT